MNFNPRTPVGCDLRPARTLATTSNFNPRTPVGCDTSAHLVNGYPLDFNPRTPVGCDHHVGGGARARPISIHAPQWGATHAETIEVSANVEISIHVPQWGATSKSSPARPHPPNFNPRTPVGCDGLISAIGGALASFQSTHPSGVRRGSPVQVGRAAYFNPRTPVGCDTLTMTASPAWWYFNPRTPVGCDDDKTLQRAFTSEFQSTHPSGVRPYVADIREMPRCISIHAPQWGATEPPTV